MIAERTSRRCWPGCSAKIRDIRRLGAGALDLCLAAEGVVDAYYEKGLSTWDLAAGIADRRRGRFDRQRTARPAGRIRLRAGRAAGDCTAALERVLADLDASGGP